MGSIFYSSCLHFPQFVKSASTLPTPLGVPPSKADLKKIKKLTAEKRKAAEKAGGGADEIFTDDELEAAGFLLEGEE